jgi:6-phosphogluconolactonase
MATLSVAAAQTARSCVREGCASEWVYFGTRAEGAGQGVQAARFDPRSGQLELTGTVTPLTHASWLQAHPALPVLYAVSEVGSDDGASVYSLAVDRGSGQLRVLNNAGSGGGGAAHLDVDPRSGTLFVANYGSGSVAALPIQKDGSLGAATSVENHSGSGPSPRQRKPHAHGVLLDPTGHFLLSADLGADRIFIDHFHPSAHQLTPNDPPATLVAPGSGPRHMAFHPNGRLLVLITELTAELKTYRWDARRGQLQLLQTVSTVAPDFRGNPSGAEVAISPNGRFVYASNRSEDTLLVYSLNPRSGQLVPVQRIPAAGHTPWSLGFDLSGRWLLVANTGSNSVNVFSVDASTGLLSGPQSTLTIPAPSSVVFEAVRQ